jgi:starvation-inducible DNA-binding protein
LKEHSGQYPVVIQHVRVNLETCADDDHDVGTNDFPTGLMGQHENMAWMRRAFFSGACV